MSTKKDLFEKYVLLHNHNLMGIAGDDVITTFRRQSIQDTCFVILTREPLQIVGEG